PRRRGRAGPRGGALDGGGAPAAHGARDPPPAGVRPRGAGGGEGDVRAAAAAPAHLPRRAMTGVPVGWLLALAVVAAALAALLSAGAAAVLRAGRRGVDVAGGRGLAGRGGARLAALVADPARTAASAAGLGVVLEVVAAVSVTLVLAAAGPSWWQVLLLALLVVGAVALVVRTVSFTLAGRYPGRARRAAARRLGAARVLARPLGRLLPSGREAVSDSQLRDMVDRAEESAAIEADEGEMFRSVLELGDTLTRAVMVPRTE